MCEPITIAMMAMATMGVVSDQLAGEAQADAIEESLAINAEADRKATSQSMNKRRRQLRRDRAAQFAAQIAANTGVNSNTSRAQAQVTNFRAGEDLSTMDANMRQRIENANKQAEAQVASLGVTPMQAITRIGGAGLSSYMMQSLAAPAAETALNADLAAIDVMGTEGLMPGSLGSSFDFNPNIRLS